MTTSQKLTSGEDVFRLLSVLADALEFVEGFVDGAPDCSRTSKSANYLALQLRTEINKWDKLSPVAPSSPVANVITDNASATVG